MQLLGVVREVVMRHADRICTTWGIVIVALVVDGVVPGGTAQPCADVAVLDVQFGKQVEAVRDEPSAEVAIPIIHVGIAHATARSSRNAGFSAVQAKGVAVLNGVVPTGRKAVDTSFELKGQGVGGHQCDCGADGIQCESWYRRRNRTTLLHVHGYLFCIFCFCCKWLHP
ncbi:hypothetical protein D9M69_380410 [compost metagenome]